MSGLTGVTAISAGANHNLALAAGVVYAWGSNLDGELGRGAGFTSFRSPAPASVSPLGQPVNVAATGGNVVSYSTPVLAADPTRAGHLAISYTDGQLSACYLSLSNDGGATWSPRTLVGTGGQKAFPPSVSDPTQKMDGCWQPNVAFGPEGNLYYEYNGIDPNTEAYSNLSLMVSTDAGATFQGPGQINPSEPPSTDPTFTGGDQNAFSAPALVIDRTNGPTRGQMYVAYTRSGPNFAGQIRLTRCTPAALSAFAGGATLACSPSTLVDPGDRAFAFLIALPAVGADGTVSVAWQGQTAAMFSDVSNPQIIQVASSTDQGQTFSAASTVDAAYNMCPFGGCVGGQFGPQNLHMSIAAGTHAGDLYVAVGSRRGEGFTRAAVSVSHDNGMTWASRVELGRVSGQLNHDQHAPQLSVAPGGQITVAYYDTAPDESENLYVTTSSDGGATYSAPRLISTASSNNTIFTAGFPVADETTGLVSTDAGFAVAWVDSRRGNTDNDKTDIEFAATTTTTTTGSAVAASGLVVPVPATGGADGRSADVAAWLIAAGAMVLTKRRRRP